MTNTPKDYVAPKPYSSVDFPPAQDHPDGMKNLSESLEVTFPHVELSVPYAVKDGPTLHLHIITPPLEMNDTTSTFPLIMWVQGSAFQKQNLGVHLAHMVEIAKRGFVVAMVEYRWSPEHPFPAQIKDLHTATRFMLAHAAQYHVDPKRYVAWGDSSGGHTVVMGTVTSELAEFSDEDTAVEPINYKACIDFYGPTVISRMNKVPSMVDHVSADSHEGGFLGTHNVYDVPEIAEKANPLNYLDHPLPPFLIMHGNKDRTVPFEQSVLLYDALRQHGHSAAFYRIEQSDHSTDAFFTPEVIQIVTDFIRKAVN